MTVRRPMGMFEQVGHATSEQIKQLREMVTFLGACANAIGKVFTRRAVVNWGDVFDLATEAGANAVPIVLLIGFLMGVIIAFEIALVAQEFGAVIFVVTGVGIAMMRELGPLMTAIVLSGRTGAAFAAQIGTQKINEEVNAIRTFGLDPIEFLVLPRLLAAFIVVPLLAVLADIVGVLGGALVMTTFDVSYLQFQHRLLVVGYGEALADILSRLVVELDGASTQ